jgi:DNA-directed RNA polymerase specialized sigma24 family protein
MLTLEAVGRELNRMTRNQRASFLSVGCDARRIAEAAVQLGLSERGVEKALKRARMKLKGLPEVEDIDPDAGRAGGDSPPVVKVD